MGEHSMAGVGKNL
jgi:hypothetical protein